MLTQSLSRPLGNTQAFYCYLNFLQFTIFLAVILLQVEMHFEAIGRATKGYDHTLILILLFGSTVAVLVLGVYFVAKEIAPHSTLMHDDLGEPIRFKRLGANCFHLFLSHTWSTGQVRVLEHSEERVNTTASFLVFSHACYSRL